MTGIARQIGLVAATMVAAVLLAPWPDAAAQPAGTAEVILARAPVEVLARGASAAQPVAKGARLAEGDRVRTGRGGVAEIRLGDGSLVRLGELSDLEIEKLDVDAAGAPTTSRFGLATGQARAWVARQVVARVAQGQGRFAVQTPTAVAAVRQTDFVVLQDRVVTPAPAQAAGVVEVFTLRGEVETTSAGAGAVTCSRNRYTKVQPRRDPSPCQIIPLSSKRNLLKDLAFEAVTVDPGDLDRLPQSGLLGKLDRTTGGQLFGASTGAPTQNGRVDAASQEGTANIIITVE